MKSFLFPSIKLSKSNDCPDQVHSPIVIRRAQIDDVNELGDILTQSFHQPTGMTFWLYPLLKLGVCEDLRNRFRSSNPHYTCLIAEKPENKLTGEEKKIMGTVELSVRSTYYFHMRRKYVYLANLAVSKNFRRQGVATKLLLKCQQVAYSWGFENIYLHVLDNNHQAKQLYLNNGYQINQIDCNLYTWLTRRPKRLFLQKSFESQDCKLVLKNDRK